MYGLNNVSTTDIEGRFHTSMAFCYQHGALQGVFRFSYEQIVILQKHVSTASTAIWVFAAINILKKLQRVRDYGANLSNIDTPVFCFYFPCALFARTQTSQLELYVWWRNCEGWHTRLVSQKIIFLNQFFFSKSIHKYKIWVPLHLFSWIWIKLGVELQLKNTIFAGRTTLNPSTFGATPYSAGKK